MTTASPPRRRRRAINTDSAPVVPAYETHARAYLRSNKAKNAAARTERDEFAKCNKAMAAAEVRRFDLEEDGKTYDCYIDTPETESVDVNRLYKKVTEGEITIEQFLACVSGTKTAIKNTLGSNALAEVVVPDTNNNEKLTIKERK